MGNATYNNIYILVIEDERIQSHIVSNSLKSEGYQVDMADNWQSAHEKIKKKLPDIIILDMNLPDMNGIAIIKELSLFIEQEQIKIVVFSADGNSSIVLEALSIGATDYILKRDDLKILKARLANVAKSIILNRKLNYIIKSLEDGLDLAREIQLSTISSIHHTNNSNLLFDIVYQPSDFVSGDIYDIYKVSDTKYRILLADASGHGIPAGFITMSIKTEYDRLKKNFSDISEIVRELNLGIFNTFTTLTIYTCIVCEIDLEDMTLTYSSSGHPSQILIQNNSLVELKITNPIMGYLKNLPIKKETINLYSNFKLFLYTDGFYEFFDTEGEVFGLDRFQDLLWEKRDLKIDNFSNIILASIKSKSNLKYFDDDITLISINHCPSLDNQVF